MNTAESIMKGKRFWNFLKCGYDPVIDQKDYAKLCIGFNVIYEQFTSHKGGYVVIPIPFMKQNHQFIRFKKVIPPETFSGYKIRCDQQIKLIKDRLEHFKDLSPIARDLVEMQLKTLEYVAKGPYNPNIQ